MPYQQSLLKIKKQPEAVNREINSVSEMVIQKFLWALHRLN